MKIVALILIAFGIAGCSPHEEAESHPEEVSLYSEHDGLTLPAEMQRELGVQLASVIDTNSIPENAIIRGAQEDFAYVKDGEHFVRTLLTELALGDQLVIRGARDLWMIELLALRGGEPCCH